MSNTAEVFEVNLLAPKAPLVMVKVHALSVVSAEGEIVIRARHAPMLTLLKPGIVVLYPLGESPLHYYVGGGCLQVQGAEINLFAEIVEVPADIDLHRAQEAEQRALAMLAGTEGESLDVGRALAALHRAKARQKLKRLDKIER